MQAPQVDHFVDRAADYDPRLARGSSETRPSPPARPYARRRLCAASVNLPGAHDGLRAVVRRAASGMGRHRCLQVHHDALVAGSSRR